jgi:pyruvate-ferredoxin/flavodoxin oxidoreductase
MAATTVSTASASREASGEEPPVVHRRQRGGRPRGAYALSETVAIYPITPSSPMGELADAWAAAGGRTCGVPSRRWSRCSPRRRRRRAARRGPGGLARDDVHVVAGPAADAAQHVQDRRRADPGGDPRRRPDVATHALSIFGDHSDVMAARTTGWTMLASNSPQEAHDLAAVAHAATLASRVPVMHFFDGFRTSHELNRGRAARPTTTCAR